MSEHQYKLIRSRRRSLSVTISSSGEIIVKAPLFTTQTEAEAFLLSKKDWILKHLEKVQTQNAKAGELGILSEEELKLIKKKAKVIIPSRVEFYAKKGGFTYNKISIRWQKSRWGSCSRTGNLNFNGLLVLMPEAILDSVIVHELCHRHHMNHSKTFYDEVYSLFPDYKTCDKWLKENGLIYLNRLPGYK